MKTINNISKLSAMIVMLTILTITASAQRTAPFAGGVKLQQTGTDPSFGLTMKAKVGSFNTVDNTTLSWTRPTGDGFLRITGFGANAGDITYSASIDLSSADVSGVLPIARGGTASGTALSGSSIMISNGTAIVQGDAGTVSTVLHGNASGAPTYGPVVLTTEVSGLLPIANGGTNSTATPTSGGIAYGVGGTAYGFSAAGTAGEFLRSTGAGTPEWGKVNLASSTQVEGILPIANGGTNSGTALNNNRIMVSSGGAIVEAAAMTNGQLLIGGTGAPIVANLTQGAGITITNGNGSITIAANLANTSAKGQYTLNAGQTSYVNQAPPAGFTIIATTVINITVYEIGANYTFTATVTDIDFANNQFDFELSGFPTQNSLALVTFHN